MGIFSKSQKYHRSNMNSIFKVSICKHSPSWFCCNGKGSEWNVDVALGKINNFLYVPAYYIKYTLLLLLTLQVEIHLMSAVLETQSRQSDALLSHWIIRKWNPRFYNQIVRLHKENMRPAASGEENIEELSLYCERSCSSLDWYILDFSILRPVLKNYVFVFKMIVKKISITRGHSTFEIDILPNMPQVDTGTFGQNKYIILQLLKSNN